MSVLVGRGAVLCLVGSALIVASRWASRSHAFFRRQAEARWPWFGRFAQGEPWETKLEWIERDAEGQRLLMRGGLTLFGGLVICLGLWAIASGLGLVPARWRMTRDTTGTCRSRTCGAASGW